MLGESRTWDFFMSFWATQRHVVAARHGLRGEHSPEGTHLSPLQEGRSSSAEKYSPPTDNSGARRLAEEWPQTKFILQREIEARSQRISANWHQWQRAEASAAPVDEPARPWRKLIVVCAKLPYTFIWDEEPEKGIVSLECDRFEANFAEILAAEIAEGQVHSSICVRPSEVYLIGAPVVRRASDRPLLREDRGLQQELASVLRKEAKVETVPVFPPPGRDRFGDKVIFPLFHYTPPSMETGIGLYDWEGYTLEMKGKALQAGFNNDVRLHLCCAMSSATAACLCTQPVDCVKTRIINMQKNCGVSYRGPLDVVRKTLGTEGPLAFYKGLSATFVRLWPHTVLLCGRARDAGWDAGWDAGTQVYQMGGECNSAFGSIGHLPFHFLHQDISKSDITALMVKAHVFMDTPLRDTLSREAHEFDKDCGVLILSEFSGSAQSLRAAAICVNPWDTTAFADAIQEEGASRWASNFLDEILSAERDCEDERLQIPPPLDLDNPVAAMRKAGKRIFVFGFSGTLLPRKSKIQAKILSKLHPVLAANLKWQEGRGFCFVRHAQALHNVCDDNLWTPDNPLTADGERQCQEAHAEWGRKIFEGAELIIVCAEHLSGATCDEGRPLEELREQLPWAQGWKGFSELQEEWWKEERPEEALRVAGFLQFLQESRETESHERQERKIVVVSHGAFLQYIVGYHMENATRHMMNLEDSQAAKKSCERSSFNIGFAVCREWEDAPLKRLAKAPVTCLQGLGRKRGAMLASLGPKTVQDLANWKFARWAESICILSPAEQDGSRDVSKIESKMNINKALDKEPLCTVVSQEWEGWAMSFLLDAPLSAFAGLTPAKDPVFKSIGLTCIKDLGEWKYYRRSILERADASGSARSAAAAAAAVAGTAFVALPGQRVSAPSNAPALRGRAGHASNTGMLSTVGVALGATAGATNYEYGFLGLPGYLGGKAIEDPDSPLRAFESELGVQAPLGYFDPMGLSKDGDVDTFRRRRECELKNGRVAMFATIGYMVPEYFNAC
eukprot:g24118.t1